MKIILGVVLSVLVSTSVLSQEFVDKKYFIKGMTCGSCVGMVKAALEKAKDLGHHNSEVEVGSMILKFDMAGLNEKEKNCQVQKAIESETDYKVFLDKDYKFSACEK